VAATYYSFLAPGFPLASFHDRTFPKLCRSIWFISLDGNCATYAGGCLCRVEVVVHLKGQEEEEELAKQTSQIDPHRQQSCLIQFHAYQHYSPISAEDPYC